ncbi:FAD-dependent monooxygenase, partial [Actinosynnema sp. NPDC023658]|uniref:FAD-dependent monooxygenase n=1 Tax=Actinosynnema sp. NPDC023658 TaxID=3155465 RepID=UPI0033C2B61A
SPSGGHYAGAPLAPGRLRVITAEFDLAPPSAAPTGHDLQAAAERLTGAPLPELEVHWLTGYGNPTRNADRYGEHNVFLAGDAAHVHFPQNGLGIGTGLHDAVNLGWKLAAVLAGRAGDELLDTYHAERYPVGAEACTVVRAQIELCHPPERVEALRSVVARLFEFDDVNRHLVETVTGTGVRYPMPYATQHPLLGRRLRTVPLETAGGATDVAKLLHGGRGVLLDLSDGESGWARESAGWESLIDLVTARPVPGIDATALLLRPDGHVAWVATAEDDKGLRAALSTWWGRAAR